MKKVFLILLFFLFITGCNKNNLILTKIELPSEIKKISRIKYFPATESLLLVAEESDGNRALWNYSNKKFKINFDNH